MSIKTYAQAINEAHRIIMEKDENVFLMGQGISSPFTGNTTAGLYETFGKARVIDPPTSECAMTGCAIGAAMAGLRPIIFHIRMDFMYLTLDQIINHAASWSYTFNGQVHVPIVIRGIINRGREQSVQHSQSPFATYAHIPGLKVIAPASVRDAKGLFIAAVEDNGPVVFFDDRWLYDLEEDIPDGYFIEPLGRIKVVKSGNDVTVIAVSYLVHEALKLAIDLEKQGISVNVVDIRTIKPLDEEGIISECKKTGRVVVACGDWECCGLAAYISSRIYERLFNELKSPIEQVSFDNIYTPASTPLEQEFFKDRNDIQRAVEKVLSGSIKI